MQASAFDVARGLLAKAEVGPLDELQQARVDLLRGQITFASKSASAAVPLLLKAAKRLEPLDAGLARETYRDAFYAALTAGRLPSGGRMLEVAEAARAAPPTPQPLRAPDLLLDGLAVVITEGYERADIDASTERFPQPGSLQGRGTALAPARVPDGP